MGNASRLTPEQRKKRKKRIIVTIIIVVVVAVLITAALIMVRRYLAAKYATESQVDVQTAVAEVGSIRTTVSSSGNLADQESEEVTLPATVTLDAIYVSTGDTVEEGDLLAVANTQTLIAAMAQIQAELDELDDELEEAAEDTVADSIETNVSGRVKLIYVDAGDDIAYAMYQYGALMVLSLDGYMSVELETELLSAGDSVTVTSSGGTEYTGSVEQVQAGVATILITDNGPAANDTVEIYLDGESIGTGVLGIHKSLAITGYAGTVDDVEVSENESVDAGDTLLTVTDTEYIANYETLLKEREELEAQMQTLVGIYTEGGIYAPISGQIESISYSSDTAAESTSDSTLMTICPYDEIELTVYVDETDILSLELGQEAEVTVDSIDDETFTGTVTEVGTTASSSGGVTQYPVTITLERTDSMRSGMSASVYITISGSEDAVRIPEDAVNRTSSVYYVYTEYDEETGELSGIVEVTVGVTGGGYTEIIDGLEEGDTVYYTTATDSSDFSSMFGSMGGGMDMGGNSGNSGGGMDMGDRSSGGNSGGNMPGGGMNP